MGRGGLSIPAGEQPMEEQPFSPAPSSPSSRAVSKNRVGSEERKPAAAGCQPGFAQPELEVGGLGESCEAGEGGSDPCSSPLQLRLSKPQSASHCCWFPLPPPFLLTALEVGLGFIDS